MSAWTEPGCDLWPDAPRFFLRETEEERSTYGHVSVFAIRDRWYGGAEALRIVTSTRARAAARVRAYAARDLLTAEHDAWIGA